MLKQENVFINKALTFCHFSDDKEDKRPLLSVKKNEEAEGEDQRQGHFQRLKKNLSLMIIFNL